MNKCLHDLDVWTLQREQIDDNIIAETTECKICGEIRIEYESIKTHELLDNYDIIKEGQID